MLTNDIFYFNSFHADEALQCGLVNKVAENQESVLGI
jgi:enoyl-CoA hydratase/carnithine racemase